MKNRYFAYFNLLLQLIVCTQLGWAQKKIAIPRNVKTEVKNDKVFIHYDIERSNQDKKHKVDLLFIDDDYSYTYPKLLSGDIGKNISGGKQKTIVWDVANDLDRLNSTIRPKVIIDGNYSIADGGPWNAAWSAFFPGIGDYFVADFSQRKIKPFYKTIAAYSFLATGILASKNRTVSIDTVTWETQISRGQRTPVTKKRSFKSGTNYWLFWNDAEILIGAAAFIWILDIAWVASIGSKNKRLKKHIGIDSKQKGSQWYVEATPKGFNLNYRYTF